MINKSLEFNETSQQYLTISDAENWLAHEGIDWRTIRGWFIHGDVRTMRDRNGLLCVCRRSLIAAVNKKRQKQSRKPKGATRRIDCVAALFA
jgi:hypothetical protein